MLLKTRKKGRRKTFTPSKKSRKGHAKLSRSVSSSSSFGLLLGNHALPPLLFETMKWIEINGNNIVLLLQIFFSNYYFFSSLYSKNISNCRTIKYC